MEPPTPQVQTNITPADDEHATPHAVPIIGGLVMKMFIPKLGGITTPIISACVVSVDAMVTRLQNGIQAEIDELNLDDVTLIDFVERWPNAINLETFVTERLNESWPMAPIDPTVEPDFHPPILRVLRSNNDSQNTGPLSRHTSRWLYDRACGNPRGWPSGKMPEVKINVPCPIKALQNFSRCDALSVTVKINDTVSSTSSAWHLLPHHQKVASNRRLVILNPGHVMDFNDPQYPCDARTIDALLANGYSVLAMLMPLDGLGKVCPHDNLFTYPFTDGSAFKIFFEPIAANLNYLRTRSAEDSFPSYTDFNMVGLSGGGWTATLYPAIDPTIRVSIQVAGTLPIYLRRTRATWGDLEQTCSAFYSLAGYQDLYCLASYGPGRKHVQILPRKDTCFETSAWHTANNTTQRGIDWQFKIDDARIKLKSIAPNLGE
ncbi:MAG: hypothetical protein FWD61_03280 [Phycisphaerales bacterium]|nr:hypothetical protein [Phycisphaerales bacterium]